MTQCPTPSVYTYSTKNFLAIPKGNDVSLRIYDRCGKLKYTITPENCYFYYKSRYVYIKQHGYNNIALDFETEKESAKAIIMLNTAKSKFFKSKSESREYYTKDELNNGIMYPFYDDRYVNEDGDTMSGDLIITTLSKNNTDTGETWGIVNMNISELGQLIKGNQHLIKKENITSSEYVDSFNINTIEFLDEFSVFWEYAVKDGQNIRAGTIVSAWDKISKNISFSHTSTMDVGNTQDVDFNVNFDGSGNYIRLFANVSNGNWKIKILRRFI
jgi:hypothetical protein